MIKKIIVIILVIVSTTFYFIKESRIEKNSVIKLMIDNHVDSFDPAIAFNNDSLFVMAQAMETLYQYHYLKRPFEVIPGLAEGMPEISNNGQIYTFKIKKNIYYHETAGIDSRTRFVLADDFIWQIKRLAFQPLKSTGKWLFEGKIKGFDKFSTEVGDDFSKFLKTEIEGVRKINDHSFQIELVRPEPNLLYFLSMQFTSPVPLEVILENKNDLSSVLVGTGPYELTHKTSNKYFFKKFKNFHEEYYPTSGDRYANTENLLSSSKKKLPFIKNVIIEVISDEDLKWNMFLNKQVDILDVPKKYLVDVSNSQSKLSSDFRERGISVKHFSRQTTRWFGFNMNDNVIGDNLNLRKAIAYAINYDRYIELMTNNTNLKSSSVFNPSIKGYSPTHKLPYSYDLEKAKKYFAKSGYKPGELTLTYSTRGTQELQLEEGEFLQSQLKKIGIELKINVLSFSDFLKFGRSGQLQFWTDNWIYDYPDAENLLQLLVSKNHPGINKSGYHNKKVDMLYEELSKTLEFEKREKLMFEIEDIVEAELPWIMLMYESTYIVQHEYVKNFRKSFFIRNYIKYLQVY